MTKAYSYIRMSTETQLKGDSLRRQIEKSEKWTREHSLDLDTGLDLRDIGLSAYDGSNVEKGQLGKFLQAVKDGKIDKGSYLLIESLDRLSRQAVRSSLSLFLNILDQGINIVTLMDGRVYRPESTDSMDLMYSLLIMTRANEESATKAHRVSEAWKNKRKHANQKILTAQTKGWLRPRPDRTGFDEIPERVVIIRRVFTETADHGIGADKIARRLNEEGIPAFTGSNGWHKSYIRKILNDRAVLGEFQPHTKSGGKRQPVGDPLGGYFPAIIDEALFYRAQQAQHSRRLGGAGRKGHAVANLFSGLARCGVCGGPMYAQDKGRKGGRSLVCSNAKRGNGCSVATGWRYDHFETSFMTFVREADLPGIVGEFQPEVEYEALQREVQAMEGRLIEAQIARERVFGLILGDEPTDFLNKELRRCDSEVATLQAELTQKTEALAALRQARKSFDESKEGIVELVSRLRAGPPDELFKLRSTVASRLKAIIDRVRVWPVGHPRSSDVERQLIHSDGERARDYLRQVPASSKKQQAFAVIFKDGTVRAVSPDADDPTKLQWIGGTGEFPVTAKEVRDYLQARYGVTEPTPEDLQTGFDHLREHPEWYAEYGGEVIAAIQSR